MTQPVTHGFNFMVAWTVFLAVIVAAYLVVQGVKRLVRAWRHASAVITMPLPDETGDEERTG